MKKLVISLMVVLIVSLGSSCALPPTMISPTEVSNDNFMNLSCYELKQKLEITKYNLSETSKEQLNAVLLDLLVFPLSKISGMDLKEEIGQLKGEIIALEEAELIKGCK